MGERIRLLVVDDDEVDRTILRRTLQAGEIVADIDEAATRQEARARLAERRDYDCLILDNGLPDATGVELVRELRGGGVTIPILVVTGNQDDETEQALVDAGATDYLPKGELSPKRLSRRLRFALRVARAEAESQAALERALQAANARDEMLAVVSHDLRGPLSAIGLACEAVKIELGDAAPQRYITAIERSARRAERLILDLLDSAKIEHGGGLTVTPAPVDGRALVQQAMTDHDLLARKAGGSIEVRLPDAPVLVLADRERVLQVFQNLIGNALQYAPGAPIELELHGGDRPVFSVRDHGPGIPSEQLSHIWDRYWRGRKRGGGAGLGLCIAKGIVEAHRGTIGVSSEVGHGTRFEFTLQRADG
jgi:signal transduction histidine kinase